MDREAEVERLQQADHLISKAEQAVHLPDMPAPMVRTSRDGTSCCRAAICDGIEGR
jgi:hypothetical protein